MSARKFSVAFTRLARQDFDDILLYSLITWGRDQATRYESQLDRSVLQVREHPEVGKPAPEVMPACRQQQSGHHVIYYTVSNDTVTIHRILHERRRVTSAMMQPEPDNDPHDT